MALIGVEESLHLEFKAEVSFTDSGNAELLKDVVAMANAEGGHIIIGLSEDGENRAATIQPVEGAQRCCDRIRDLCSDRIERRLSGLHARVLDTADGSVVVIRVPNEEPKPHWIRMPKSSVRIFKRFGVGARQMTLDEVRSDVLGDRSLRRLEEIASRIDSIETQARNPIPPGDLPAAQMLREADPDRIRRELDERFRKAIGDAPVYRLSLMPVPVPTDLPLYERYDELAALVKQPPRVRSGGWDLTPTESPQNQELGVGADDHYHGGGLQILFNAAVEYWARTDTDTFQWAYSDIKAPRPFYLDPMAIIEPIVCLMELGHAVCELVPAIKEVKVTAEFWNCDGAKLIKYPPGTHGHRIALHHAGSGDDPFDSIGTLASDRVCIPPRQLAVEELTDQSARLVVVDVYRLFGHTEIETPQFDETCQFKYRQ